MSVSVRLLISQFIIIGDGMNDESEIPLSDEEFLELIQKCQAGDPMAGEEFFRRYNPHLKRCIRRYLTSPALRVIYDSNDIMNSVLRRFWGRKEDITFSNFLEFQAYMSQIVQNRIKQANIKLCNELSARRKLNGAGDELRDISENELAQELIIRVRENLTEEEWKLFEEVKLKNKSFVEIAAKSEVGEDAIRKRFNKIYEKIKIRVGVDDLL